MGKISPVSAKYIVHATISVEGVVDKSDVIGAIFGQTEGLLGADLELRELQRSGKIGRIEVNLDVRNGKSQGDIIIPSSLDKAETAIIGAALEIIQRIGPCNAKLQVHSIEDVRISKREFVIGRAKELLKELMDKVMPDSQELADEVINSVRVMEITEYGRERLPAGPGVEESDEVIVVEGRADVLNLLKHGFKNAVAINGTSVPPTIIELSHRKTLTVFVDGDRGGNLIIRELLITCDIDYVTKAPDGKEVEEITKKEIHKALRSKIAAEQVRMDIGVSAPNGSTIAMGDSVKPGKKPVQQAAPQQQQAPVQREQPQQQAPREQREDDKNKRPIKKAPDVVPRDLGPDEKELFGDMLEDLIGTRGAYLLDDKLNMLGKLPVSELQSTLRTMTGGIFAVIFDGVIDKDLLAVAETAGVAYVVAMDAKVKSSNKTFILTSDDL